MRNVLVVLNDRAGALLDRDPTEVRREVESALRAGGRNIEVVLERGQGIVHAVEHGAAVGYDTLIVGGGDGSVSCATDRLAGKPVTLGVLPLGTSICRRAICAYRPNYRKRSRRCPPPVRAPSISHR